MFVWYPAKPQPVVEFSPYLPPAWTATADFLGLNLAGVRSHAISEAAVAGDNSAYPVLLLSPSGFPPLLLSAIAEELASHGYVVVGVNHAYETTVTAFADGRGTRRRLVGRWDRRPARMTRFSASVHRCANTRLPILPR